VRVSVSEFAVQVCEPVVTVHEYVELVVNDVVLLCRVHIRCVCVREFVVNVCEGALDMFESVVKL
jgi:hypothetical protein